MSPVAEIAAFIRLADGGLPIETLARAIGRRWPRATVEDVHEAMAQAADDLPDDLDDRAAMDLAMAAILGRRQSP